MAKPLAGISIAERIGAFSRLPYNAGSSRVVLAGTAVAVVGLFLCALGLIWVNFLPLCLVTFVTSVFGFASTFALPPAAVGHLLTISAALLLVALSLCNSSVFIIGSAITCASYLAGILLYSAAASTDPACTRLFQSMVQPASSSSPSSLLQKSQDAQKNAQVDSSASNAAKSLDRNVNANAKGNPQGGPLMLHMDPASLSPLPALQQAQNPDTTKQKSARQSLYSRNTDSVTGADENSRFYGTHRDTHDDFEGDDAEGDTLRHYSAVVAAAANGSLDDADSLVSQDAPSLPPLSPATKHAQHETFGHAIVARFSYEADPSDPMELSFSRGERLHAADISGSRWWNARKADGTVGIVPSNYMRPVDES